MNYQEILHLTLDAFLSALALYLAFFKSYFQEKGKNIATKEDIEEITIKIESIKNEFHFSTQSKISLKLEERNSLVNCYEKYTHWLNTILFLRIAGINEGNKEEIKIYENQLHEAKHQFELASGRMALFVNNEELSNLLQHLHIKTYEIHGLANLFLHQIAFSLLEIRFSEKQAKQLKTDEAIQAIQDARKKHYSSFEKYNKDILEKCAVILPLDRDFRILAHTHLHSLIESQ
jgi:hypothetical protein